MKNKMKLWRREAAQHNKDANAKHQGRKFKLPYDMTRTRGVSGLMAVMFQRAGLNWQEQVDAMVDTVLELNGKVRLV